MWRGLEAEAAEPCFFRGWSWVGCLAGERFCDPVLIEARWPDGRLGGLALFNRRGGRLTLGASGDPALDAPYVEHNAPLLARDAPEGTVAAMLAAAWRVPGVKRLVLPGVPVALAASAGGVALRMQAEPAPFVDLDAVRAAGGEWLAGLSANARQQLRRSRRHYEAAGLGFETARDVPQALGWLDALIALHAADWARRGKPGAFASPFMVRFHRALITDALPRGGIALHRATSGGRTIGHLYNFRAGREELAYQSGLDHAGAGNQGRPGLTLHHLAIERALADGLGRYDFLAGAARYKTSLANASRELAWTERARAGSAAALLAWMKARVRPRRAPR